MDSFIIFLSIYLYNQLYLMFQKTIGEWDCIKTRGFLYTECPSCQTLNSGIQFLESSSPVDIGKDVRLVMSPTGFLSTQ